MKQHRNMTYEECVNHLIHNCGLKGNGAIALLLGKKPWRKLFISQRMDYKSSFRMNFIPYMIYEGARREPFLILGSDRVQIVLGLQSYCKAGKFSAIKRNQYVKRLLEGTFPDPNDQHELALELDLLMNPPSDIIGAL